MPIQTFAERFCAQHGVPPADFVAVVLPRILYPRARWLRPVLGLRRDYFTRDREFIIEVGQLTSLRGFESAALDFSDDPANRSFLRRTLNLRSSVVLLRRLVRATFRDEAAPEERRGTATPWDGEERRAR